MSPTLRALLLVFATLLAVWPSRATATNRTRQFCEVYNVDYADGATGDLFTAGTMPARGVKWRFHNLDLDTYEVEIADVNGADAGCVTKTLDDQYDWDVAILRHAEVGGNVVQITNASHVVLAIAPLQNYTPVATTPYVHTSGVSNSVNVIAAATNAIRRDSGSVSGETLEFHLAECPWAPELSCYDNESRELFMYRTDLKFLISHEIGHFLFDAANGYAGVESECGAPVDDCVSTYATDGHVFNSKEWQSCAAWEGFASFYAAYTYNLAGLGADCVHEVPHNVDWDRDLDLDGNDPSVFSCEEGIPSLSIDSDDYLGDYCLGTGQSNNRGTRYDWTRFLWDLKTDVGLSLADLQEIWVGSDPDGWNGTGNGTGGNYPAQKFHDAAETFGIDHSDTGFLAEWDALAADQGVHR